jgi:hypothetical protein
MMIFLNNPYARLDSRKMGKDFNTNKCNHRKLSGFFWNEPGFAGALPGSTVAPSSSSRALSALIGALPASTGALSAFTGALPYLYRLYHTSDHVRFVPAELRCFLGVTPVVPGRAKDESGKAILPGSPRTSPVILNILFHPESNAGCSRIILDVAGRVTYVLRLFPTKANRPVS